MQFAEKKRGRARQGQKCMGKIVEQYIKHDDRNLWDFEIVSQPGYENIFSSHLGSRLKEEIARTGVVVYRRSGDV